MARGVVSCGWGLGIQVPFQAADYYAFAQYVAGDLAERIPQSGEPLRRGQRREEKLDGQRLRVQIRGRHIAYSGSHGMRGSDAPRRLSLMLAALERYHRLEGCAQGVERRAARTVAGLLLHATDQKQDRDLLAACPHLRDDPVYRPMRERWRARFLQGRRGRRAGRGEREGSELSWLAEIVRSEVRAYRRKIGAAEADREFEREFATWYGNRVLEQTQRTGRCADPEWFDSEKQGLVRYVESQRRLLALKQEIAARGPQDELLEEAREILSAPRAPMRSRSQLLRILRAASEKVVCEAVASALAHLGWLRHLRGDFVQAEQAYREAMAEYESGRVRAQVSRRMVAYLREQIERCRGGRPPAPKATISIEELGMAGENSAETATAGATARFRQTQRAEP